MKVLLAQLLVRHLVPHAAAIAADFDALWPVPAARVRPAVHADAALVDDDGFVDRRHDGARDGHLADAEAGAIGAVVLADLWGVVEVFFLLDGGEGGAGEGGDAGEPFAGSGD